MKEVCYAFSATAKFMTKEGEDPAVVLGDLLGDLEEVHITLHEPMPATPKPDGIQVDSVVIEALTENKPLASEEPAR